jgi:mannitol/fructose-specific phosphotransferase system IIA component (Ntr-type)
MLLGELLQGNVIKLGLDAESKWEAIEELIDLLIESHSLPMSLREHVIQVVKAREESMSTGMGYGVALPHGSTDRFDSFVAALGVSKAGIEFESIDGEPAKIIILMVVPQKNFQGQVRTLAGIAHLLSNPAFRSALLQAKNVQDVMTLIESEEQKGRAAKA